MPDTNKNAERDLALKTLERKAPLLRLLSEAPDKLATVSVVSQWVWDVDAIVRSQLSLIETQAAEIARLRKVLTDLADAGDAFGIRSLVAGWNGENDTSGPHAPHPSQLGVKLPTNCGAVYAFDDASRRARAALQDGEAGNGE